MEILDKGRSPQFPGLDQINLRLSENVPLGCRVPITVVVDGRTSNFGTLAIASRGERCNEPHGLDSNTYERISAGETLNIGWFQFTRLMVALPVAEIRAIIDFGFGDVFAAGQLSVTSGHGVNTGGTMPYGTCMVHTVASAPHTPFTPIRFARLDAGATLTVTTLGDRRVLPRKSSGLYEKNPLEVSGAFIQDVNPGGFLGPGLLRITGQGGIDVGPFEVTAPMPNAVQWNSGDFDKIDRSRERIVTWTPEDTLDSYIIVSGMSLTMAALDGKGRPGKVFSCTQSAATGEIRVPAYILSAMPRSMVIEDLGSLSAIGVGRAIDSRSTEFISSGLDVGMIGAQNFSLKQVTFE